MTTRQNAKAIFDIMEQNLILAENLIRETRATFNKARRMMGLETDIMGIETDIVVGTDGEDADQCQGGSAG